MLTASPELAGYLASLGPTETCMTADLYTFTLTGGAVLRYTTADRDVSFGGNVWPSGEVRFQDPNNRAVGHWKIGLDVDSWQVLAVPRSQDVLTGEPWPDTIGTQPFLAALFGGALSGADVQIDRAFFDGLPAIGAVNWTPIGALVWFAGRVVETDIGQSACVLTFNDYREQATLQMPQQLFQTSCRHVLFGPGCNTGIAAATFAVDGAAEGGSTEVQIVSAIGAPGGSGTYALGKITMTSGANEGFSRTVRDWSGGVLHLQNPFYWPIAPGDTFTAWPGCDHTQATCALFGNSDNFGGFPFIPVPETAT